MEKSHGMYMTLTIEVQDTDKKSKTKYVKKSDSFLSNWVRIFARSLTRSNYPEPPVSLGDGTPAFHNFGRWSANAAEDNDRRGILVGNGTDPLEFTDNLLSGWIRAVDGVVKYGQSFVFPPEVENGIVSIRYNRYFSGVSEENFNLTETGISIQHPGVPVTNNNFSLIVKDVFEPIIIIPGSMFIIEYKLSYHVHD